MAISDGGRKTMICQNCHFCTTSKDAAQKISLMPVTGYFCEKQPK
jgi:hypothetical protein